MCVCVCVCVCVCELVHDCVPACAPASGDQVPTGSVPRGWASRGSEASEARKWRIRHASTADSVARCRAKGICRAQAQQAGQTRARMCVGACTCACVYVCACVCMRARVCARACVLTCFILNQPRQVSCDGLPAHPTLGFRPTCSTSSP